MIDIVYAMGTPGGSGGGAAGGGFSAFIPMILIFGIFYFLLIRPQQKKAKEHREMIGTLKKGDRIITSGGIYGRITNANDSETITVEIADKVKVKCARGNIGVLVKSSAAASDKSASDKSEKSK
ncbi:preprotein translocase subunit YajC [Candidatus Magnetomoraceae bacterium gMMP-15]